MYDNDLISVIIPVYNCEKYVRQTLDSVVNQTYKNLEILVINDGSTDNSLAICNEYLTDDRVKVFHRENAGVAASRQFGVDMCKGTYFVTLDSDDYLSTEYVEKLYRSITDNRADISVCGVACFDDGKDGIFSSTFIPQMEGDKLTVTKELLESSFYEISCDLLLTDSWNKMYRTQFLRDSNIKFELPKIYRGPDLQVNHKLTFHLPVYSVCREVLLFHRSNEDSIVHKKDRPIQQGFEIITESLIAECETAGLSLKEELSKVYYGLVGLVVYDIFTKGDGIRDKHNKFKTLISRNNSFLSKYKENIRRFKGFETFRMINHSIPAFALRNAFWLDVVSEGYGCLLRIKIRCIGKRRLKNDTMKEKNE